MSEQSASAAAEGDFNAARYDRLNQTFIERAKMRSALAIVGGGGALGNEIIKCLSMLGCGRILIADCDEIKIHNATRSVFFNYGRDRVIEPGTQKATFLARSAQSINPDVRAAAYVGDIFDLGHGIIRRANMVFSAFDNHRARFVLNARCAESGQPMFDGGLGNRGQDVLSGGVTMFDARTGPCFSCLLSPRMRRALSHEKIGGPREATCTGHHAAAIFEAGGVPSTPMMASIIGAAEVSLGVKYLMGSRDFPAVSGATSRWFLSHTPRFETVRHAINADCSFHDGNIEPDLLLPESSAELTLWDILKRCEALLGGPCVIDLPVEVATATRCTKCGVRRSEWLAWSAIPWTRCQECRARELERDGPLERIFAPSENITSDRTLREIGFPLGVQLEVRRSGGNGRGLVAEVAGDVDWLFSREDSGETRERSS